MSVKNGVIAGDYKGYDMIRFFGKIHLMGILPPPIIIDKTTVERYEVVDKNNETSISSAFGRAAAGSLLFGPIGLAAGFTAQKKNIHTIALYFKDGKKSLLEVNDANYKAIMKKLF
ncbi:MAG: hypothetical protein PUJ56_02400 [Butyricicoccus sp.]|nr:hypothetical protein [Butyricicoccus sp.]MDY4086944.1 hypothetical protein [Butyricicoccus intestinisimiae]